MDSRRSNRFEVKLACKVYSPSRTSANIQGVTLNISRSGVLVAFGELEPVHPVLAVGQPARILLELPNTLGYQRRYVDCLGRVVRVCQGADSHRVAFELRRYQIRDFESDSAESDAFIGSDGSSYIQ